MSFGDLEPLIRDADNMVDVLVNLIDDMGLTTKLAAGSNHVFTQWEGDRLSSLPASRRE